MAFPILAFTSGYVVSVRDTKEFAETFPMPVSFFQCKTNLCKNQDDPNRLNAKGPPKDVE